MSLTNESQSSGVIPSFPFQEGVPVSAGRPSGEAGGEGQAGPDLGGLQSALAAAVKALQSVHEQVGEWQRLQREGQRLAAVRPPVSMPPALVEQSVAPREVFPVGRLESSVAGPRAVLSPAQQAQLDAALADAFSNERAGGGRGVEPAGREAGGSPFLAVAPPVEPVALEVPPPAFALVDPPPAASLPANVDPVSRVFAPQVLPAPASLMAAAPPLPGSGVSPFAVPAAETPIPFAVEAAPPTPVAPVAVAAPPPPVLPPPLPSMEAAPSVPAPASPAPAVPTSTLPFSPFQGMEPPPPPPAPAPTPAAAEAAPVWPTSPFFGASQATTAPFRVVEPPPLISSTAPSVPLAAPPAPAPAPAVALAPVAPAVPPAPIAVAAPAAAAPPAPAGPSFVPVAATAPPVVTPPSIPAAPLAASSPPSAVAPPPVAFHMPSPATAGPGLGDGLGLPSAVLPPAPPAPVPVAPAPVAPAPPASVAPAAPAAPAAFPPIPDQGQVFNFAELLRANGQR